MFRIDKSKNIVIIYTDLTKKILKNLNKIDAIKIHKENLKEIKDSENFKYLTNLKILEIPFNGIFNIDKVFVNICDLENLVELDLRMCGITKIPNHINKLKNIKKLHLSWNLIDEFNNNILDLDKLEDLCIHGNKIKKIEDLVLDKINETNIKIICLKNNCLDQCTKDKLKILDKDVYL